MLEYLPQRVLPIPRKRVSRSTGGRASVAKRGHALVAAEDVGRQPPSAAVDCAGQVGRGAHTRVRHLREAPAQAVWVRVERAAQPAEAARGYLALQRNGEPGSDSPHREMAIL